MYIQGFLIPVFPGQKDAYAKMAADAGGYFQSLGAIEIVEGFEADVPDGKVTDFRRAVKAEPGEHIVFSWIIWPDKATCDAAHEKMQQDDGMTMPEAMPFDGKRMIFGGFEPVYTLGR